MGGTWIGGNRNDAHDERGDLADVAEAVGPDALPKPKDQDQKAQAGPRNPTRNPRH